MKNSSYRYLKNSKRIINYKQLYANKYNHSYEMDKFLEKQTHATTMEEEK